MSATNTELRSTEIHLVKRPQGKPTLDNFSVVKVSMPPVVEGQLLVRNLFLSVDPYMRGRMSAAKSYAEPYALNAAMGGGAIGEVVESTVDGFKIGDRVLHGLGWRSSAVVPAAEAVRIEDQDVPLTAYLGVLGMTGLTAYVGLLNIAKMVPGDTVFVSGAAGAVGSVVGQLAKLKGAKRVVGSAGSAEKVRWLTEDLGFDAAFNYKDGPVVDQLREAAPDGIDVYFDNVGGEHLEAAIAVMNTHGRIAISGMIAQYNSTEPTSAPRNLAQIVGKRLTIKGLLATDHSGRQGEFLSEVIPLVQSGKLKYSETIVDGIENAPQAFLDLLNGGNTGKMLVRL